MIFGLYQIFRLSHFCLIFSFYRAYLVSNFTTINHTVTTIFDLDFFGFCYRPNIFFSIQYQDEQFSNSTKTLDKLLIKIGKSKENLNIFYSFGFKSLFDCFNSLIFHTNTLQRYYITNKSNFFLIKSTFFLISIKKKFL